MRFAEFDCRRYLLQKRTVVLFKDVLQVKHFAPPPRNTLLIYASARKELPLIIMETTEAFIPIVEESFHCISL